MLNDFLIQVRYGGLGDHLFNSHLPRIAKESGYKQVFISNYSDYRSESYKSLVWEMNPYIDGFIDSVEYIPEFNRLDEGTNILDKIMLERGLDDGKRFHEPEIYYKPQLLNEYKDLVVYDPNFVSYVGKVSLSKVQKFFGNKTVYQLKLRGSGYPLTNPDQEVETTSLTNYCDIIHSCKEFYCLSSGGATLAAALGKPSIVLYGNDQMPMFHHSKLHTYINLSE